MVKTIAEDTSCYTAHINTSKYQKCNKINQPSPLLVGEKINQSSCLSPEAHAEDRQSFCGQPEESIFPSHIYSGCLTQSLPESMDSFALTLSSCGAVRDPQRGAWRRYSQTALQLWPFSLANPCVIINRTYRHLYNAVRDDPDQHRLSGSTVISSAHETTWYQTTHSSIHQPRQ